MVNMFATLKHSNVILAITLLAASGTAMAINFAYYQYPGNNYLPKDLLSILMLMGLVYLGVKILFGNQTKIIDGLRELLCFILVLFCISFATTAVQYTPFATIDHLIRAIEISLGIYVENLFGWVESNPLFKLALEVSYDALAVEMIAIAFLFILQIQTSQLREYYFLLLSSTLLGFIFYYFFPTTAPASIIENPYFSEFQRATYLKFWEIHHHIQPSTVEGGLISLPSFHVIWAWYCLYMVRKTPLVFYVLLPINLLLFASCVLLGWHYPTDLLGSIIIIGVTHIAWRYTQKHHVTYLLLSPQQQQIIL